MSNTSDTPTEHGSTQEETWDSSTAAGNAGLTVAQGNQSLQPMASMASTASRRSLCELMQLHAEKGQDLKLSSEEEKSLSEELGLWVSHCLLRLDSSLFLWSLRVAGFRVAVVTGSSDDV